jgi:hypothetical protein
MSARNLLDLTRSQQTAVARLRTDIARERADAARQVREEAEARRDVVESIRQARGLARGGSSPREIGRAIRERFDPVLLADMRDVDRVMQQPLTEDQARRIVALSSTTPDVAVRGLASMIPGMSTEAVERTVSADMARGTPLHNALMGALASHIETDPDPSTDQLLRYVDAGVALMQLQALDEHAATANLSQRAKAIQSRGPRQRREFGKSVLSPPQADERRRRERRNIIARAERASRGKGFSIIGLALKQLRGLGLHATAQALESSMR